MAEVVAPLRTPPPRLERRSSTFNLLKVDVVDWLCHRRETALVVRPQYRETQKVCRHFPIEALEQVLVDHVRARY